MFELLFTHPLWAYRAGKLGFASEWPLWWLLLLIGLAGAAIAYTLSRRRFLGLPRLLTIGALQLALAALVLTLVWRPVLTVERVRDRQNVLAVLIDNSGSMAHVDQPDANGAGETRLQIATSALQQGPIEQLGKIFELRYFAFGAETKPIDSLNALPQPAAQSRIGDALLNVMQTAGSAPLAGVMLISDGGENGRSLSEANLRSLSMYGVPVHTIGVGPEKIDNDVELLSASLPSSAAPNSIVTADLTLRSTATASTRLRVFDGDTLLAAKELKLAASNQGDKISHERIEFPSGAAGIRELRFAIDALPNERNQVNNSIRRMLSVPTTRRSILYVEGEPRWEFKFIRRALEGDKSLRFVSVVRTTQNKLYRQGVASSDELANGFPATPQELFAYDAVIVGSYEAPAFTPAQHDMLKDFVDRRGGGVLFLAGRNSLADGGWGNAAVAQAMPIHLPIKRSNDFQQGPIKALLTQYGVESMQLRFDADPKVNAERWATLPDLANYQRVGALKPGAVVLLEGQLKNEKIPLLIAQRFGRGVVYVLATASTQRWQMSLPSDDPRHEIFWRQLLHSLADHSSQRAWLSTDRDVYSDERNVHVTAQLLDDSFHPAQAQLDKNGRPQVELSITPAQGNVMTYAMQPVPSEPGQYEATIDATDSGMYKAEVTARLGDKSVANAQTAFAREDDVVEHFGLEQHRAVLQRIAAETSGRYWRLDQLDALSAAIPYTKSGIVERQVLSLWNLPIIFLLLMLLKVTEWLLRLRWGTL